MKKILIGAVGIISLFFMEMSSCNLNPDDILKKDEIENKDDDNLNDDEDYSNYQVSKEEFINLCNVFNYDKISYVSDEMYDSDLSMTLNFAKDGIYAMADVSSDGLKTQCYYVIDENFYAAYVKTKDGYNKTIYKNDAEFKKEEPVLTIITGEMYDSLNFNNKTKAYEGKNLDYSSIFGSLAEASCTMDLTMKFENKKIISYDYVLTFKMLDMETKTSMKTEFSYDNIKVEIPEDLLKIIAEDRK